LKWQEAEEEDLEERVIAGMVVVVADVVLVAERENLTVGGREEEGKMEQLIPYIPAGAVIILLIGLSVQLKDHPTFKQADERYPNINVCNEKHKAVDEKLACFSEVKETVQRMEIKLGQIEILLKRNGGQR